MTHGGVVVANVPNVDIGGCVRGVGFLKALSNGTYDLYVRKEVGLN